MNCGQGPPALQVMSAYLKLHRHAKKIPVSRALRMCAPARRGNKNNQGTV